MNLFFVALFFSTAVASPPEKPDKPERYPAECPEAIGVTSGLPFNVVDVDYRATCSGVLLPTSQAYYLQAIKIWAKESQAYYEAQHARQLVEIAQAQKTAQQYRRAALYATTVAVLTVGGGYAVSQLTGGS